MKVYAIVAAAGSGTRMASGRDNKTFIELGGKPLLHYALSAFEKSPCVHSVTVAVKKSYIDEARTLVITGGFTKVVSVVAGGETRTQSVRNALAATPAVDGDIVMIHDGARPFLTESMIRTATEAAHEFGAAVVGVPCTATIKEVAPGNLIKGTPERSSMWEAQTPQAFRFDVIRKAYERFAGEDATDDSAFVERMGLEVRMVEGSRQNIKITTPEDIVAAEAILKNRK